ncbi:hypothetical protein BaRGS_00038003, partial [Batillaria attramentaria]
KTYGARYAKSRGSWSAVEGRKFNQEERFPVTFQNFLTQVTQVTRTSGFLKGMPVIKCSGAVRFIASKWCTMQAGCKIEAKGTHVNSGFVLAFGTNEFIREDKGVNMCQMKTGYVPCEMGYVPSSKIYKIKSLCIAVTVPLHAVRILTMKRVKIMAGIVLLWSVLFNIPRYMLLEPTQYWEPSLNTTWIRLEPSPHALSQTLLLVYFGYVNTIVKVAVPVLLVSLLNVILLCSLRRRRHYLLQQVRTSSPDCSSNNHHKRAHTCFGKSGWSGGRRNGGSRSSQGMGPASNHRVTSVVLAITGVFLLSQLFAGAQVLIHLLDFERTCGQPCVVFTQVCDTVFLLVSATNFLLYYAFGEKFRKIIKNSMCCRTASSVDS